MTAYFDELRRQVREFSDDDTNFIESLISLEHGVIKIVNLVTGDREFPDDLRDQIQGIIAVQAIQTLTGHTNERAKTIALRCRYSGLFESLHSAFHSVAGRRLNTRFGLLSDDPSGILRRRDAHDGKE